MTVTVTDFVTVPPAPVQANAYVELVVGDTASVPDTGRGPDHAPNAVLDVESPHDQMRSDD
jgi:hypothetical protein